MNDFEQLAADFWEKLQPLSSRAKSLFFVLSAYRLLPLNEPYQASQGRDPKALQHLADEIFRYAVTGEPVPQSRLKAWVESSMHLCPDEDEAGLVGPTIEYTCSILWVAANLVHSGEANLRLPEVSVESCLSPFRYTIGADLLDTFYPGDDDADDFYAIVMKDPRFKTAQRRLEEDLADLRKNDGDLLAKAAQRLKERALKNQADIAGFLEVLGEGEE